MEEVNEQGGVKDRHINLEIIDILITIPEAQIALLLNSLFGTVFRTSLIDLKNQQRAIRYNCPAGIRTESIE